jgi:hypothetical protein
MFIESILSTNQQAPLGAACVSRKPYLNRRKPLTDVVDISLLWNLGYGWLLFFRGMGDFPRSSRGMGDFPHAINITLLAELTLNSFLSA